MTKLMDAILQNLQVWRANRKKQYYKHETNYTSKVEKRLIVNDFFYHDSHWRNVNVTEKMIFLICLCV